jgi:hypothetical protein
VYAKITAWINFLWCRVQAHETRIAALEAQLLQSQQLTQQLKSATDPLLKAEKSVP